MHGYPRKGNSLKHHINVFTSSVLRLHSIDITMDSTPNHLMI